MDKIVKLEDVARELNVSIVTVSNALAGRSGVSEELRSRIVEKAGQMGYRKKPRREKKTPSTSKLYQKGVRIGVIVPDAYLDRYTSFYWELYQRLALEASRMGCFMVLEILTAEQEEQNVFPAMMEEEQVDAIITLGILSYDYMKMLIEKARCTVQMLDFNYDDILCDAVVSNGFYGSYQMTNYLIGLGHKKIGFLGEKLAAGSIMDRYQGYSKSLMEHDIEENAGWIVPIWDYRTGDIKIVLPDDMPTAFVCSSDYGAEYLATALMEAGYKIPEEISLVGYDDFLLKGKMQGRLTTYSVDMDTMAHQSLKLVFNRINGDQSEKIVRTIDGKRVIRTSAVPCFE